MPSQYKNRTVPDTTDPPDGPANFRTFTDSVFGGTLGHVDNSDISHDLVAVDASANRSVVGVAHSFAAGSLIQVVGDVRVGAPGSSCICYLQLVEGSRILCQTTLNISGGTTEDHTLAGICVSTGASRVDLKLSVHAGGNASVDNRSVHASAVG
jgi:hypothetical protein